MKVGIVGGGNMGLAYARSLVRKNLIDSNDLLIYETFPERIIFLKSLNLGTLRPELDNDISKVDVLILAVKPQSFNELSLELKSLINPNTLIISIMAGVRRSIIEEKLSTKKVVRVMPNTPAQNGLGATGYHLFTDISIKDKELVESILLTTGLSESVENEEDIDSITALSGSGPAYVYLFAQAMSEAGLSMGLSQVSAKKLTLQTIKGALNLMETTEKPFDELIAAVKSKGGTTEAALLNFEKENFKKIVENSLFKAKSRAKELSDEIEK